MDTALNKLLKAVIDTPDEPDSEDERRRRLQDTEEYDWEDYTAKEIEGTDDPQFTGGTQLWQTTGDEIAYGKDDVLRDSDRWKKFKVDNEEGETPNIQNDSALNKLLKAVKLEDGRRLEGIGTQYGTSPTDPFSRIHEIEPDDYGPDTRYHQVDTSSHWGTPDLHSYGYGHEKPDISGESVKPYWEQMNELPTIEEEQETKQAESPIQKLMNQVLG